MPRPFQCVPAGPDLGVRICAQSHPKLCGLHCRLGTWFMGGVKLGRGGGEVGAEGGGGALHVHRLFAVGGQSSGIFVAHSCGRKVPMVL